MIRFRNLPKQSQQSTFIRGYRFQGSAIPKFNFDAPGLGAAYKEAVKQGVYAITLTAFGESLAKNDNYVSIDPELEKLNEPGVPAGREWIGGTRTAFHERDSGEAISRVHR